MTMLINWLVTATLMTGLLGSGLYLHLTRDEKYHFKQLIAALIFLGIVGWTAYRLIYG